MNTKTTPKDFFLHLGATVALYAAAVALINLSFNIINYLEPDALASYFYSGSIAWPISMLIVLIPLLYVLEWLLVRDIRLIPEKKDLWIRKWRIYLTLFLAGATIIGDLIVLINTYLSGEVTSRFIYKILAILIICGAIFAYYLLARITEEEKGRAARKTVAVVGLVLVIIAIIAGFVIVGSPSKQRALRFDSQRVNDLQSIQWQVINFWQRKATLPTELAEVKDSISGNIVPSDPDTDKPYEYAITGKNTFELCAMFSLPTPDLKGRGAYYGGGMGGAYYDTSAYKNGADDIWKHETGRTCFKKVIDPTQYPPNKPVSNIY
ncbi:MAG: DUF5671 domain-containing protein [Candidatus Taylorbacteria bacterium]|nr:DUF5671 domain-containing protein [Candidatus Taylorbacteria bacterium]